VGLRRLLSYLRRQAAGRWAIVRLLPAAGRPLVAAAVGVQVVAGVVPVAFVLTTSALVGLVQSVVGGADPSWPHVRGMLALASVLFAVQLVLGPVAAFLGRLVARRVDDVERDRIVDIALRPVGTAPLESATVLDRVAHGVQRLESVDQTPGAACAGTVALVSRYLQAVLATLVVAVVLGAPASVALLAAALALRVGYRSGLTAFSTVLGTTRLLRRRRHRYYLRDMMLGRAAAADLRLFGLHGWIRSRYRAAALDEVVPLWRRRRRTLLAPYVPCALAATGLCTAVLATAASSVADGVVSVGALALVVQSTVLAMRLGGFIAESDVQTQFGMTTHQSIDALDAEIGPAPEPTVAVSAAGTEAGAPGISFRRVSFTYPGAPRPTLRDLDLDVEPGSSLAVVGRNGAGKTTLVKLLARLYEPSAGAVLVDGRDLATLDARGWQRNVAAVFQDFVRFDLSLRDNVALGCVRAAADDDAVRSALRRAGLDDLPDRLPDGLGTPLSSQHVGGVDLSGGQWQRVALARALRAVDGGARVLVLDEPTASLDAHAELEFYDRYLELTRGLTTVIVSHRFSTVRKADKIAVLSDGHVSEQGTHDELVARGGRYAEMFAIQAAAFLDGADA